jgi:hypothetical protein
MAPSQSWSSPPINLPFNDFIHISSNYTCLHLVDIIYMNNKVTPFLILLARIKFLKKSKHQMNQETYGVIYSVLAFG